MAIRRETPWTVDEDNFLRQNLHKSNKDLATELNTTVPLVKSRLLTLKLRRKKSVIISQIDEEWRQIPFALMYSVSNYGRVKNNVTNLEMKQALDQSGYKRVTLRLADTDAKTFKVHRLVALLFLPYVEGWENLTVNHENGIKTDNTPTNLKWMTFLDNIKHSYETGLQKVKYSEELVRKVCEQLVLQESVKQISKMFNMNQATVVDIRLRRYRQNISKDYIW